MSKPESKIIEDAVRTGLRRLWEKESALHEWRLGVYYPSYLGYCLRKQYYIYTVGEKPSSEKLAIFATGRGVHKAVEEAINESGLVKVEEVEKKIELQVNNEVIISGRVDLLLASVNGEKIIVEVKSTSRLPEEPLEHHVLQLQAYLHAENVEKGVILYWDKRRGSIRAFMIPREEAKLREIKERAVVLHNYLASGREPPREAVIENRLWECELCEYKNLCKPFLLPNIREGETILVAEVDGVLVDDTKRREEALARIGRVGSEPSKLPPEDRSRYYQAYYSKELLVNDTRGPWVDYVWKRRAEGTRLVIVSSRPSNLRRETEDELRRLGLIWDYLMLRPEKEQANKWKSKMYRWLGEYYVIDKILDHGRAAREAAKKLGVKTL